MRIIKTQQDLDVQGYRYIRSSPIPVLSKVAESSGCGGVIQKSTLFGHIQKQSPFYV
ncbi:hypothetical protein [Paenibacillus sp. LHD-38]|uniref:hypothetical protein n=1 Tax=Paenibacillus sp. LHD-38 TaxID=3072143 RepID=UPI00280FC0D6|nr:hypothetical protein [Paenibacillus sp. LHD-38]MDQ8738592.1 hypothetical protein [Paenibacillus sp. LHD-38]